MLEANQLLKYLPEAFPTLKAYLNVCKQDVQECYILLCKIKREKKTTYKYETNYRGKEAIYIYNSVGDQTILYAYITEQG